MHSQHAQLGDLADHEIADLRIVADRERCAGNLDGNLLNRLLDTYETCTSAARDLEALQKKHEELSEQAASAVRNAKKADEALDTLRDRLEALNLEGIDELLDCIGDVRSPVTDIINGDV